MRFGPRTRVEGEEEEEVIEALLFDNDGILVDTEPLYLRANREILAEIDIAISDAAFADLSLRQGKSVFELARERGTSERDVLDLRSRRDARYLELIGDGVAVIDGVKQCLLELHGRLPMAIVTSSKRIHFDAIHEATGLLRFFDAVVASGDYARHKPHPEPFLAGAQRLSVAPKSCVAIEDSPRGLAAAVAAGMRCLAIPTPLTRDGDFRTASAVLASAREIPAYLEAEIS